jgi:plasmid stability protein
MSRREKPRPGRTVRVRELLESGDHRSAAVEARAVLTDAACGEDERAGAAAALASLRPEPAAVAVGLGGVVLSLAVVLWMVLGSGR